MDLGKVPPHDIELEKTVLGSMLIDEDCYENQFFRLTESLFYDPKNLTIFNGIKQAQKLFGKVDLLTVVKALQKEDSLQMAGGAAYVSSLTNPIASTANIETHIKLLQQVDVRRKLISFSQMLLTEAYKQNNDPLEIHEISIRQLSELADFSFESNDLIKLSNFISTFKDEFEQKVAMAEKGVKSGIITGFEGFDNKIGAFRKGNLITIAGRPGIGKTAVLITFIINIAKQGIPVLVFSIEMSYEELVYRMIISEVNGKIPNEALQSGKLNNQQLLDKQEAEYQLKKLPITISDKPQSLSEIQRKTKRWAAENPNGIAMLDYLQLVTTTTKSNKSREQEVSDIARGCKNLAKECMIPFIALSQLSRSVEQRGGDKRPITSDLRESGEIENASDIIIMLYRDAYYDINQNSDGESTEGVMEWIIRKNRHGAIGMYKIFHNEKMSNFSETRSDLLNYATPSEYNPASISTLKPSTGNWDEELDY